MVNDGDEAEELLQRVAAEEDILSYRSRRDRLKLLMHHCDTHFQRAHWVCNVDRLSVEKDFALIHLINAEHTFHKRRLAGAVFAHERMDGSGA